MSDIQFKPGDLIADRWKVMARIGARVGDALFSVLFEVSDVHAGGQFALKVYPKTSDHGIRAYIEHLRALEKARAYLPSGNLVLPIESGETESCFFQVFPLVSLKARSLRELIRETAPLHPSQAMAIAAEIAASLGELETHSLIHGDIKPENILITPTDGKVFVID